MEQIDLNQTLASNLANHFAESRLAEWHPFSATDTNIGLTTFSCELKYAGVLVAKTKQAIPQLLELANQYQFYVVPIASNRNWGYGIINNPIDDKPLVFLDLSQLKSITPTSKELGLVTLEPGVTQQDLRTFFDQNGWDYLVPVTGAGPNCGIVSNALERGYGITPHTDHFQACTALKAYLPHPDLCQTEYSSAISEQDASGSDFIDKSFKWGVGPYLDGIFTQSNFGVVSEMTFRLAPTPPAFAAFYVQVFDPSKFALCVSYIRETLKIHSGSVGSINFMDRRRLLSMTVENPNLNKDAETYLTEQQVEQLAKENKTPEWLIVGSIYGTPSVVNAVKKEIKQGGRKLGQVIFSDSGLLKLAKHALVPPFTWIPALAKIREQLVTLDEGIDIMLGKPNQVALPLAYWRNRKVRPNKNVELNPAKDGCGLLWYAPLVEMDASKLDQFVTFVRSTLQEFDLDPFITFTNLRHDCIDSTVPIVFNLESPDETARAEACLSALVDRGVKQGFVPYRLNAGEQTRLEKKSVFWQCASQIKQTLDPNEVLSPGKYS